MSLADDPGIRTLIALAKEEDLGTGDITSMLLKNDIKHGGERSVFSLVAKQAGVFAGEPISLTLLHAYDESIELQWAHATPDSYRIENVPTTMATIHGPLFSLLAAERVFLNFLQRLSGVATRTRSFVDAVANTGAIILDTRKTIPGWRLLDKYAVRCGGGTNHRRGLSDAVLIKDNHLEGVDPSRLAFTVFRMLNRLGELPTKPSFVEVEARCLADVEPLLSIVGVDTILLDNFSLSDLRQAVMLRDGLSLRGKIAMEASGGVTLETVRLVAETGVDRISVGALTHSTPALDLSLERVG